MGSSGRDKARESETLSCSPPTIIFIILVFFYEELCRRKKEVEACRLSARHDATRGTEGINTSKRKEGPSGRVEVISRKKVLLASQF